MDYLLNDMMAAPFWIAALQIIGVNIVLSGDNAVVIAMACMTLPPRQRLWGMVLGAGVAVLLRVLFTLVVAEAMAYPFLKLAGGVLLLYVAIKLVTEDADGEDDRSTGETLWRAVRIVAIADIVMSLDNVIAIAASAELGRGSRRYRERTHNKDSAHRFRSCHQCSAHRRRQCDPDGAAATLPYSRLGRWGIARLGRGRYHGDRSGARHDIRSRAAHCMPGAGRSAAPARRAIHLACRWLSRGGTASPAGQRTERILRRASRTADLDRGAANPGDSEKQRGTA